jgi:hypothetical protein
VVSQCHTIKIIMIILILHLLLYRIRLFILFVYILEVRCAVSRLSGHLHKLMVLTAVCPVEGPSDPSSGAITPPILQPKRAETFSGFENRMSGNICADFILNVFCMHSIFNRIFQD